MEKGEIIEKLLKKKGVLEQGLHRYDGYVHLCQTKYFNNARSTTKIIRNMGAIDMAIDLLNNGIGDIDVAKYAMQCVPSAMLDEMMDEANSIYLNERKKAVRYIIEYWLPICKKPILELI